jgi:hypothetical protein
MTDDAWTDAVDSFDQLLSEDLVVGQLVLGHTGDNDADSQLG